MFLRICLGPLEHTAAIYGQTYPHLASALLNHRDPRVTEDHYNLSARLTAGEEYALIAKTYREPLLAKS
jgi:hypothetical protein